MGFEDEGLGLLGGLAEGIKSGIQGYNDAEDRQFKRMMMQAQMEDRKFKILDAKAKAEAAKLKEEHEYEIKNKGLGVQAAGRGQRLKYDASGKPIIDPTTGGLQIEMDPTLEPLNAATDRAYKEAMIRSVNEKTPLEIKKMIADKAVHGFEPVFDANGQPTDWKMLPWKVEQLSIENKLKQAQMKKLGREGTGLGGEDLFKKLPVENQEQIKKIADKMAGSKSIYNALSGDMMILQDPKIDNAKKLVHARSMIKTLNSTQGQDAVGAEEAKRLAGLLEFRWIPNFTEPGAIIGRSEIGEFINQVQNRLDSIRYTNDFNEKEIQNLYGTLRPRIDSSGMIKEGKIKNAPGGLIKASPIGQNQTPVSAAPNEMQQKAIDWLKSNPNNPKANAVKQKLIQEGVWK